MKFEWRCECNHLNEVEMKHWKKVRDLQGFTDECNGCGKEMDIDINLVVKAVK